MSGGSSRQSSLSMCPFNACSSARNGGLVRTRKGWGFPSEELWGVRRDPACKWALLRGFSFLAGETRLPRSELLWRGRTSLSRPSESFRKPRLRPENGAVSLARRSAPLPRGRAEHRDCTEGKKHRAKNVSIPRPSRECAEQRQEGEQSEVARLGVHSRSRLEGAATRLPLLCASWALNR